MQLQYTPLVNTEVKHFKLNYLQNRLIPIRNVREVNFIRFPNKRHHNNFFQFREVCKIFNKVF